MTRLLRRIIRRVWWKLRHPRTPYGIRQQLRIQITADISPALRDIKAAGDAAASLRAEIDSAVMQAMRERIALDQDRAILGQPIRRSASRERYPWEPTIKRPRWVEPVLPEQPVWARLSGYGMSYGTQDAINPYLFSGIVDGGSPAIPHSVIPASPDLNNYAPPCSGPSFTDCSVASDSAGAVGGME